MGDEEGGPKTEQQKVCLVVKIGRHGEKGEHGELLATDTKPQELGQSLGTNTKVYTSFAPRAFQTAQRVAEGASTSYETRPRFELITSKLLPPEFSAELRRDYDTGFDRVLNDPTARALAACGIANTIEHFRQMSKRLHGGTIKNLINISHDLEIAAFLKEVLVRHVDGQDITGFSDISEIGGEIDTNEYFEVIIERDNDQETVSFQFDNPNRLPGLKCTLNLLRIEQLAALYKEELKKAEQAEST